MRYPNVLYGFLAAQPISCRSPSGSFLCDLSGSMHPISRCRLTTPVMKTTVSPGPEMLPRNIPPTSGYIFILWNPFSMIDLGASML